LKTAKKQRVVSFDAEFLMHPVHDKVEIVLLERTIPNATLDTYTLGQVKKKKQLQLPPTLFCSVVLFGLTSSFFNFVASLLFPFMLRCEKVRLCSVRKKAGMAKQLGHDTTTTDLWLKEIIIPLESFWVLFLSSNNSLVDFLNVFFFLNDESERKKEKNEWMNEWMKEEENEEETKRRMF
jgi:hypothetical protein